MYLKLDISVMSINIKGMRKTMKIFRLDTMENQNQKNLREGLGREANKR